MSNEEEQWAECAVCVGASPTGVSMQPITSIAIEGVQSIESTSLERLGLLNIFVGANGVGKSALLRALNLAFAADHRDATNWIRRGETKATVTIRTDLEFLRLNWPNGVPKVNGPGSNPLPPFDTVGPLLDESQGVEFVCEITETSWALTEWHLGGVRLSTTSNAIALPGGKLNLPPGRYTEWGFELWKATGMAGAWTYLTAFREIGRTEGANLGADATARGQFLANTLLRLRIGATPEDREKYRTIVRAFQRVVGRRLQVSTRGGQLQLIVASGGAVGVPLIDSGSGLENFVSYLIHVVSRDARFIGLEEPESHLHPAAHRQMWRWLLAWAQQGHQLFVSTHSVIPDEILSASDVRVFTVHRDPSTNNSQAVLRVGASHSYWPELGYGAGEWVGADGVLLVEGKSDCRVINYWARRLQPLRAYRVVQAQGKSSAVAAGSSKVFEQLNIPCATLVDRSGRPRLASVSPGSHLFQLQGYEIENYLLRPSALANLFRKNEEEVAALLKDASADWLIRSWARDFWEDVPVPIRDAERSAWARDLTGQVRNLPLDDRTLEQIARDCALWLMDGRPPVYDPQRLSDFFRTQLVDHTTQFLTSWSNDPLLVVPGKEFLAWVRKELDPGGFRRDWLEDLVEQVEAPQELYQCIGDLEKQSAHSV